MSAFPGSLLLVTNRAPVSFRRDQERLRIDRGAGGVVTALGHLSRVAPVTWIAAAVGRDDQTVAAAQRERGGAVGSGRLTLRLLHMDEALQSDFYGAFANRVLWFVQHRLWSRRIGPEDPEGIRALAARYVQASGAFADAVVAETLRPPREPAVMAHDYQLYALPALLRARLSGLLISHFVHIPWPALDVWCEALPRDVCGALLSGVLGADAVGFQDEASRLNFAGCVAELLPDAIVSSDRIARPKGVTLLRVRPASVDPTTLLPSARRLRELRSDPRVSIVRVDRVDPIKNVPFGFNAYRLLLERRPDLVGRVRFVARLAPSRATLPEYRREWQETLRVVAAVNARFGEGTIDIVQRADREGALAELASADVVLVNSLADGMNLVAKESAVLNPRGVLVLSRTTGAFNELGGAALGIDPSSLDDTAAALERAIEMRETERRARARTLSDAVLRWTSRDWSRALLEDLAEAATERDRRARAAPYAIDRTAGRPWIGEAS